MPTPPRDRLRLQALEDRCLLSADLVPPEPIVVRGTDAHDVITLNRIDEYRVEVTVQSFRDAEWTEPTGDPVKRYEVETGGGWFDFQSLCMVEVTTGTVRVEAGAGTDRIEVADGVGFTPYVRGTNRTAAPTPDDGLRLDGTPVDEGGGRWAAGDWSSATVTVVDGVDMPEGAVVEVRFHAWLITLPAIIEPGPEQPADPGDGGSAAAEPLLVGDLTSGDGLGALIGEGDARAATPLGSAPDGDPGPGRPAGLADVWVEGVNDASADPSDWWAGDGADGTEWLAGGGTDDWLLTDLDG